MAKDVEAIPHITDKLQRIKDAGLKNDAVS